MEKLSAFLILITGLSIPFLYLPQFFLPSNLPKFALALLLTLLLSLVFCLKIARSKKIQIFSAPLTLPLLLLLAVNILSLIQSSGKFDAAIIVAILACSIFLYILIPQLIKSQRNVSIILYVFSLSIAFSGLFPLIKNYGSFPEPLKSYFQVVNESGAVYLNSFFLIIMIPIVIGLMANIILNVKNRRSFFQIPFGIVLAVVFTAGMIVTFKTVKLEQFGVLDRQTGWIISLETIKKHPLFGIGPGNFINAYTLYKPFYAPNISYPNLDFTPTSTSSNNYFLILTTTGTIGLLTYLLFIFLTITGSIKKFTQKTSNSLLTSISVSFVIFIILQGFFPLPQIVTFYILIILGLSQSLINKHPSLVIDLSYSKESENEEDTLSISAFPFSLVLIFSLIIVYIAGRTVLGEYYEKKAVISAKSNDAKNSLGYAQKAIELNPIADAHHANFAQINYLSAISLLQEKKDNLTDNDRTLISQLFQKAIDEGKIAVSQNPQKVYNLQTLAAIYAGLAKTAVPGAEQFSIETYKKALDIDPTNPKLRIDLGEIYFNRNEFATASSIFKDAVLLQANYANAHYNLGHALLRLNQFETGIFEIETAANLLPDGNTDKERILLEIEDLKAQIASLSGQIPPPSPKPNSLPTIKPSPAP